MTVKVSKSVPKTFLEAGFIVHDMAKLLSVSERTWYRRCSQKIIYKCKASPKSTDRRLDV